MKTDATRCSKRFIFFVKLILKTVQFNNDEKKINASDYLLRKKIIYQIIEKTPKRPNGKSNMVFESKNVVITQLKETAFMLKAFSMEGRAILTEEIRNGL